MRVWFHALKAQGVANGMFTTLHSREELVKHFVLTNATIKKVLYAGEKGGDYMMSVLSPEMLQLGRKHTQSEHING